MTEDEAWMLALDALVEGKKVREFKALAQPEQEPIGTLNISRFKGHLVNHDFEYFGELSDGTYSLYTSPPKCEWVGLTDEEYTDLAHRIASKYAHRTDPTFVAYTFLPHTLEQFVRSIEDALQEKNT